MYSTLLIEKLADADVGLVDLRRRVNNIKSNSLNLSTSQKVKLGALGAGYVGLTTAAAIPAGTAAAVGLVRHWRKTDQFVPDKVSDFKKLSKKQKLQLAGLALGAVGAGVGLQHLTGPLIGRGINKIVNNQ